MSERSAPQRTRTPATIDNMDDVRRGMRSLVRTCVHMRTAHALAGDPPLRREPGGFEGLARIVIAQQVSIASAEAIWRRFAAICSPVSDRGVLTLTEADFRRAGLSRPKIRTLSALSEAVAAGRLDLDRLSQLSDADVHGILTAQTGIGPWTADIYLMFCLGRADRFAPGDLALQIAAQRLMELPERPDATALAAIAERWRPWRGVAARMLWAYYRVAVNTRSGAPM